MQQLSGAVYAHKFFNLNTLFELIKQEAFLIRNMHFFR